MVYKKKQDLRVILVFDNQSYMAEVRRVLETAFNCSVLAETADQETTLKSCYGLAHLMIVSLDNQKLNSYHIAKQATWENLHLRVLAIPGERRDFTIEKLIESGFRGVLDDLSQLSLCVETLMSGKYFFPKCNISNS